MIRANALLAFALLSSLSIQPLSAPVLDAGSVWVGSHDPHTSQDVPPGVVQPTPTQDPALAGCPTLIVETFGDLASEACQISYCESRWQPDALGDISATGEPQSLGWFQLWRGWGRFVGVEPGALLDPAVNAATALRVREHRGRWGGAGGWTCADLLGIP